MRRSRGTVIDQKQCHSSTAQNPLVVAQSRDVPLSQVGETFRQVRAHGLPLGPARKCIPFFSLLRASECSKSRSKFPLSTGYRSGIDTLPISTGLESLPDAFHDAFLLHFLPSRRRPPPAQSDFSTISRAFGIERANVGSFIVHRVVYLAGLSGFSPWLELYYRRFARTMRHV